MSVAIACYFCVGLCMHVSIFGSFESLGISCLFHGCCISLGASSLSLAVIIAHVHSIWSLSFAPDACTMLACVLVAQLWCRMLTTQPIPQGFQSALCGCCDVSQPSSSHMATTSCTLLVRKHSLWCLSVTPILYFQEWSALSCDK